MNLFDLIENTAANFPDKDAVVMQGEHYTYGRLVENISDFSLILEGAGIKPQQKVGLMFPNGPGYIIAFFSLLCCDAIAVPISSDLRTEDIRRILREMEIEKLIVHREYVNLFDAENLIFHEDELRVGLMTTPVALASIDGVSPSEDSENLSQFHVANIRFTSGTTSSSKGVVLSHETIHQRIITANKFFKINEGDTIIWTLSMAHHFAVTICCHLSVGATIVVGTSLLPDYLLNLMRQHKGTILYATPLIYKFLTGQSYKNKDAFDSTRLCISTAMSLNPHVVREFYQAYHFPITNAYGLIEVGIPLVNTFDNPEKMGSVGRPIQDFEVKIFDQNNAESKSGEIGHLGLRGPGMLDAYYKPWRLQKDILINGWFVSGDLARKDDDGFFYIVGRDSDIINVGGMKVFPYEVEDVLCAHPGVKEACVVGEDDRRFGQIVKAYVVASEQISRDDLLRFCEKRISFFKVPKKIEFVSSLPKTSTGKILRRELKLMKDE
jgi:acyl-coenzyme A synthetase/AMP-(fatty) acid ligase